MSNFDLVLDVISLEIKGLPRFTFRKNLDYCMLKSLSNCGFIITVSLSFIAFTLIRQELARVDPSVTFQIKNLLQIDTAQAYFALQIANFHDTCTQLIFLERMLTTQQRHPRPIKNSGPFDVNCLSLPIINFPLISFISFLNPYSFIFNGKDSVLLSLRVDKSSDGFVIFSGPLPARTHLKRRS